MGVQELPAVIYGYTVKV